VVHVRRGHRRRCDPRHHLPGRRLLGGGTTDRSEAAACSAEARTLVESADAYMTREQVDVLPAMGVSANRYELALIDAGHLDQVSTKYDLHEDGTVTANGHSCR
jgi:hypothetical protein